MLKFNLNFPVLFRGAIAHVRLLAAALLVLFANVSFQGASHAQGQEGQAAAQRLVGGKERKNQFRGGVGSQSEVESNMKKLFEKIMITGSGDGKADKWYSPHLRDDLFNQQNKDLEAVDVRGQTAPFPNMITYCLNPFSPPIQAACPITVNYWFFGPPVCQWHGESFGPHRPIESCFSPSTLAYKKLNKPSNFKTCCVRYEDESKWSEMIALTHPMGDGWAGLFEYYYPTEALGWENDRTTTMIATKQEVGQCLAESDKLMEGAEAQKWVAGAIERNLKAGGGAPGGAGSQVGQQVSAAIKEVRPKDKQLRFADSLQSEGLTLRVNFATMNPEHRKKAAERFCMHPAQFDKLMSPEDPMQLAGGMPLEQIPIWSNYCKEGVNLMTDPNKSFRLRNIDGTDTKLDVGMQAWNKDPLYCQKINFAANPNMYITGFEKAIHKNGVPKQSQAGVGHTCLDGGKLNGGMVPVSLYRHAAVERRAAIADHAMGFLIAGGIDPAMISGKQSYYKRFEPQPYTSQMELFGGLKFAGGGTNELNMSCPSLSGEDYRGQNKSDRLYISDVTHQAFTEDMVDASVNGGINRYGQEFAKNQQAKEIAKRGLDKDSQNYAAPFRTFATCPAGYTRWRPPPDEHNLNLIANIEQFCRNEYFGGRP